MEYEASNDAILERAKIYVVQITSSDNGITSVTGNNKCHEPIWVIDNGYTNQLEHSEIITIINHKIEQILQVVWYLVGLSCCYVTYLKKHYQRGKSS